MLEARVAVKNLHAYRSPVTGSAPLRLDFNENTQGCSPRVLACLRSLEAGVLARYLDREPGERLAADFLGLPASQVLLTNGVDEAIHLLCATYLEPGDQAFVVAPTFEMYSIFAGCEGARVIPVAAGENFAFPLENLLSRVGERTRLIAIANPNNPTGTVVDTQILLQVARAAPNAAVLADEAYFEFHGKTVLSHSDRPANLFVARTFSKAYGLAGLRLGLLAGQADQMSMLRRVAPPYNVNSVALSVLPEALRDQEYVHRYVTEVQIGREMLRRELATLGLPSWPSQANFLLVRIGPGVTEFMRALQSRGILVRDKSSDPGCEGCVRITLGTVEHTQSLISGLREVILELAGRNEVTL
jgi:histidinol-phosphate aminotransferase